MKTVALELQPCCRERSGIGLYTYELAKHLHSNGDIEFRGNVFNFIGCNNKSSALDGIDFPIHENRMFTYGIYRRIWNMIPVSYQSVFPPADLNVFFNYIVPPRVDSKIITIVYDMTCIRHPETMESRNLRRLQERLLSSVECSNRIITISEFSKHEIIDFLKVPEDKIDVIYCAPSLPENTADFTQTAEKFGIKGPYILYVGTIEPRKNLTRLMQSFAFLKQTENIPHQLVLVGGKGWKSENIYQTARELSCCRDIIFTGYISAEEKAALYQNAEVFVFPSLYEGFGIPPIEAMHLGCPVVCADAASLPEIAGDAAVLVDPLKAESIAEGIISILHNETHRQELVEKGYTQEKKYTWDASARNLERICRELVE